MKLGRIQNENERVTASAFARAGGAVASGRSLRRQIFSRTVVAVGRRVLDRSDALGPDRSGPANRVLPGNNQRIASDQVRGGAGQSQHPESGHRPTISQGPTRMVIGGYRDEVCDAGNGSLIPGSGRSHGLVIGESHGSASQSVQQYRRHRGQRQADRDSRSNLAVACAGAERKGSSAIFERSLGIRKGMAQFMSRLGVRIAALSACCVVSGGAFAEALGSPHVGATARFEHISEHVIVDGGAAVGTEGSASLPPRLSRISPAKPSASFASRLPEAIRPGTREVSVANVSIGGRRGAASPSRTPAPCGYRSENRVVLCLQPDGSFSASDELLLLARLARASEIEVSSVPVLKEVLKAANASPATGGFLDPVVTAFGPGDCDGECGQRVQIWSVL